MRGNPDEFEAVHHPGQLPVRTASPPRGGTMEFDFVGIEHIGTSFAGEVFRVFANANTAVALVHVNANEAVARWVRRAQASRLSRANQG